MGSINGTLPIPSCCLREEWGEWCTRGGSLTSSEKPTITNKSNETYSLSAESLLSNRGDEQLAVHLQSWNDLSWCVACESIYVPIIHEETNRKPFEGCEESDCFSIKTNPFNGESETIKRSTPMQCSDKHEGRHQNMLAEKTLDITPWREWFEPCLEKVFLTAEHELNNTIRFDFMTNLRENVNVQEQPSCIWKSVLISEGLEAIEFKINRLVVTTKNDRGTGISAGCNLIVSSKQHQHEKYVHIIRDKRPDQIQKMAEILLDEEEPEYKGECFKKEKWNHTGEKLTRPNSTGTEVKRIIKDADEAEEPARKEEEKTFDKAKAERKRTRSMSYNTLYAKGLQFRLLFCWIIGYMTLTASASFSCPETQTAELGKQGFVVCSFPDSFHAVLWYGEGGDSSPLVTQTHGTEEKTELCLENDNYDVFKNGTLLICNVTVWHEKNFTVISYISPDFYEELTVSLKAITSPGNRSTTVQCDSCREGPYQSVHARETLSCSFNGARPPVQIEWVERYPHGDSLTVTQDLKVTNNSNGTYNSSADLHLVNIGDKKLAVFVCVATFVSTGWRREEEVLLDFSQNESFSSVPSNTFYMEMNRRAEIKCGGSSHTLRIWKIVSTIGESETIGFKLKNVIKMTKNIKGIEISPVGNLIFSSPQLQHEGEYACVYSDGVHDQIQKTTVILLIPPSPPYIKITGCDDTKYICVLNEDIIRELTCMVDGVYPNAILEWVSKNPSQISFYNGTLVSEDNGRTYDVSASVNYRVSVDVLCEDDIYIECRLQGPIARIIKAERIAQVKPASCIARSVDDENELTEAGSPGLHIVMSIMSCMMILVRILA